MYRYFLLCSLLLAAPAVAQPTLLFESEPGLRLVELGELIPTQQGRFDYNGDGVRDLSLVQGDGSNATLLVRDMTINEVIAHRPLADAEQAMGSQNLRFLGYYDPDGNGQKEAAFFDRDARVLGLLGMLEGGKKQAQAAFVVPARSIAIMDLDGDGATELIVGNPQTETVQVYGATAIDTATETLQAALAPLLENYPNPFREATTIAYEVDRAGPVTLTVYDLLGRTVVTLVDAPHTAGRHEAAWDGRDGSGQHVGAGAYFYQLRVGDTVSSKQAVRVR